MSFNLKDALNGILMKSNYTVGSDYNQFAINAYLGKYKQYISILNKIMGLVLPNQAHYDYLRAKVGYGWPSKLDLTPPEEDPMVKYIMESYECSRLDARDYLMFISEQEKLELMNQFVDNEEKVKVK